MSHGRMSRRIGVVLAGSALLWSGAAFSQSPQDCKGFSLDGRVECTDPVYKPIVYEACDQFPHDGRPGDLLRSNLWGACLTQMGFDPNKGVTASSEGDIVALASCHDAKLGDALGTHVGGFSGAVPWLPGGARFDDGVCFAATVLDIKGHDVLGAGQMSGQNSGYSFRRREIPTCPTGWTSVTRQVGIYFGVTVACKKPVCSDPTKVLSKTRPGVCLTPVDLWSHSTPSQTCDKAGDPILPLTGAMEHTLATGFTLGGKELVFTFDTARQLAGFPPRHLPSLGSLWSSSFHKRVSPGSAATEVNAFRGDGKAITFTLTGGSYVPEADIVDSLVAVGGGFRYTDMRERQIETYNAGGQLTRVDRADGRSFTFTYTTAASAVAPDAGYLLAVTDNDGRKISFEYEMPLGDQVFTATRGRIARVIGPDGRILAMAYDANSNLVRLTWPDGKSVQFVYERPELPWAMTGRIDENGSREATWTYDASGRATGTSMALGVESHAVTYADPPQYTVVETEDNASNVLYRRYTAVPPSGTKVTLPNGQQNDWGAANVLGRPLLASKSQPAGSGCEASTSQLEYDARGNVASRVDFDGSRTCFAYDGRRREVARVEGLPGNASCSTVLPEGAALPAGARRITTAWHPLWSLPTMTVAPLRRTTSVYHGQPDPLTGTTANCTSASAMPDGSPLPLLCKQVEQALLPSGADDTAVTAKVATYTYDASGRMLTAADGKGQATTYAYWPDTAFTGADPDGIGHTAGDLQSVTDASAHVTQFSDYDKAGRLRRRVDATGVATQTSYTPRGWVSQVKVTAASLADRVTTFEYDNTGLRTRVTSPDGTVTTYSYDAAHRLVSAADARGNRVDYTLDVMGNRVAEEVRDASNNVVRTITRSFDALNRLQQVTGATQ